MKSVKKIYTTIWVTSLFLLVVPTTFVHAQFGLPGSSNSGTGSDLPGTTAGGTFSNPLNFNSIEDLIQGVLAAVVYIGLPIAVLFIVYAGFMFIVAQGNQENLKKAKFNILWVIVGVALFLGAFALSDIIAGTIQQLRS